MSIKKKTTIYSLSILSGLIPIMGFIASCKNNELSQKETKQQNVIVSSKYKEDINKEITTQPKSKKQNVLATKKNESLVHNKVNDKQVVLNQSQQSTSNSIKQAQKQQQQQLPILSKQQSNTETKHISTQKQSSTQSIIKKEIDDHFYPQQNNQPLEFSNLAEEQIRTRILNTKELSSNYYSHVDFKLKDNFVIIKGDGVDSTKLQLLNKDNQVVENVNWYVRTRYPYDEVYKSEINFPDPIISLKKDGTIVGLPYVGNDKTIEVWAEYKGYLFKAVVRVLSKSEILNENEISQAKAKAKEITKDWHHLSDFQKALKAYEWITSNVKYNDRGNMDDQTAYSSLIELSSVCTGYTKGYKMLLDELGVPCQFIYGRYNGISHIWNLVEIEGKWYHVDATWGAFKPYDNDYQYTIYNYFLIRDEDFVKGRTINNPIPHLIGHKYRFAKMPKVVTTKEDVEKVIEQKFSQNTDQNWFNFNAPVKNFNRDEIEKAIEQKIGSKIREDKVHITQLENMMVYAYQLDKKPDHSNPKQVDIKITKYNHQSNPYILKLTTPTDVNLSKANIEVKNAFIDKIEKIDGGYLVYLTNFDNIGNNIVEINLFKIGYNFKLDQSKFAFDALSQPKPEAIFTGTGPISGVLSNIDSTMEYRIKKSEWIPINSNQLVLQQIGTVEIEIRKKATPTHITSPIQIIKVTKPQDIDKEVKVYNNQVIGVNPNMEYRLINSDKWVPINTLVLKDLANGTYEFRTKPSTNQLSSEIFVLKFNRSN